MLITEESLKETMGYKQRTQLMDLIARKTKPVGECLEWTGEKDSSGYGRVAIWNKGKRTRIAAHRFAYVLAYGALTDKMHVIHSCDNPSCVNSDHLTAGSHKANMADMKAKGRSMSGVKSPRAKLTEEQVAAIRKEARMGSQHDFLAMIFNVSRPTITKIVNGTSYVAN